MFEENKGENQEFTHYLNKFDINDTHTISESKSNNEMMSPLSTKGNIQIVNKKSNGRSTSQIFMEDNKKFKILNSEHKKQDFHIPGKKRLCTKQVFKTSGRISYDFNKYEPFSIGHKKSISDAISEAQTHKEPENVYIKANNYYLNNFNMNGEGGNSKVCFKLNEILKEKEDLKEQLRQKLKNQPNMKNFKKVGNFKNSGKRGSSSPLQMLHKIESPRKSVFYQKETLGEISDFSPDELKEDFMKKEIEKSPWIGKEGKFEDLILKYSLKSKASHPMMFENSLAHIKNMNSQMRFAHKMAKLSSPTNKFN
mmetsp:Transcript_24378/g.21631  ORF Transcript_24378/g.21631 Transcript_24378/m.21631 type:complete len:310 (-) Transcript_24378:48-977(-)